MSVPQQYCKFCTSLQHPFNPRRNDMMQFKIDGLLLRRAHPQRCFHAGLSASLRPPAAFQP